MAVRRRPRRARARGVTSASCTPRMTPPRRVTRSPRHMTCSQRPTPPRRVTRSPHHMTCSQRQTPPPAAAARRPRRARCWAPRRPRCRWVAHGRRPRAPPAPRRSRTTTSAHRTSPWGNSGRGSLSFARPRRMNRLWWRGRGRVMPVVEGAGSTRWGVCRPPARWQWMLRRSASRLRRRRARRHRRAEWLAMPTAPRAHRRPGRTVREHPRPRRRARPLQGLRGCPSRQGRRRARPRLPPSGTPVPPSRTPRCPWPRRPRRWPPSSRGRASSRRRCRQPAAAAGGRAGRSSAWPTCSPPPRRSPRGWRHVSLPQALQRQRATATGVVGATRTAARRRRRRRRGRRASRGC